MSHIMWKELLRSKKYVTLLFTIFTCLFFIVGVLLINLNRILAIFPDSDIEIYGELVVQEKPYAYCSRLNVGQWKVSDHEQVDSYNLIYRNLVNLTDEITLAKVSFSVVGCSVDFINYRLSDYIVEGRAPEPDRHEVLMGENMARLFGLSVGSVFDNSLCSVPAYHEHGIIGITASIEEEVGGDGLQWTVSGIIRSHQMQYDCGMFIPVEEERLNDLCNKVNIYFNGDVSEDEYQEIKAEILANMREVKGDIYQSYNEKIQRQRETSFMIFFTAISMLVITYILMLYIFKNDARKIGILNALGLKNRTVIKYYLSLFSVICSLGFVTAVVLMTLYTSFRNKSLVVMLGVSEMAYALDLKTCFILISGGMAFLLLLGIIICIKIYRCRIVNAVAQK